MAQRTKNQPVETKEEAPVFEREKVVFRARSKNQLEIKCSPCEDSTGKIWTGQGPTGYWEDMTEEERKKISHLVTPTTVVQISSNTILDLKGNARDRENWKWLQKHPYISLTEESKDDPERRRTSRFFVLDEEERATLSVKSSKVKDKVRYLLQYEVSKTELVLLAEAMGFPEANAAKPEVLINHLFVSMDIGDGVGYRNALLLEKLMDKANKKSLNARVLANRLITAGEIKMIRGEFQYGSTDQMDGVRMGKDKGEVATFLLDPKNSELVNTLTSRLDLAELEAV